MEGDARGNLQRIMTTLNRILCCVRNEITCSILDNNQLNVLFLNVFISCLYMFPAASAHHQEEQIVLIHRLV